MDDIKLAVEAQNKAVEAELADAKNQHARAQLLYYEAAETEQQQLQLETSGADVQPRTKGIIGVSAASLYLRAHAYEQALSLADRLLVDQAIPAFARADLENVRRLAQTSIGCQSAASSIEAFLTACLADPSPRLSDGDFANAMTVGKTRYPDGRVAWECNEQVWSNKQLVREILLRLKEHIMKGMGESPQYVAAVSSLYGSILASYLLGIFNRAQAISFPTSPRSVSANASVLLVDVALNRGRAWGSRDGWASRIAGGQSRVRGVVVVHNDRDRQAREPEATKMLEEGRLTWLLQFSDIPGEPIAASRKPGLPWKSRAAPAR